MNPIPSVGPAEQDPVLFELAAAVMRRTGNPEYAQSLALEVCRATAPPAVQGDTPGFATLLGIALEAAACCTAEADKAIARQASDAGAVASLRPADREVLRLVYWDRLSMAEVAECLGCSIAQAGRRLGHAYRRAERRLRAVPGAAGLPEPEGLPCSGLQSYAAEPR